MTRIENTIQIDASPHEVYLAIRALDSYPGWLRRSIVYRGTRTGGHDGYVDTTTIGRMSGRLLEDEPDRMLHFHQAVRSGRVDADIRYAVDGTAASTRVVRVGELITHGVYRAMQPVLVRMAAAESKRTMRALKTHVEHPG
ncbi:SRPBCC family protein [Leifsonia sp. NPDC077715]|uniref:SRPBCC family protein n=1 Tax=Leifsonia sp. NPDC077715 TaxID=3155539 RepID=UPI003414421A